MATTIRIILVDDEIRFRDTLADRLRLRNFEVMTASDGFDALTKVSAFQPDLALVDLKMPGMDGETLLRELKSAYPLTEVVILTGHGSALSEETCTEAGAYSYLHKPCGTPELAAVLLEAFERRVLRRLGMERDRLEQLIQRTAGESSFHAIIQLKKLEEQILKRQQGRDGVHPDDNTASVRID